MDITFPGKTALVTGAGSGIGEAIARGLAASGASVLVQDLNRDAAVRVAEAADWGGGLHLLVNNAGIGGPLLPTGEYTIEGWHRVMDVNLNAVFYGMRYAIPRMLDAGGGAIVNIASILGSVGFANASAYTAAKHALLGLTRATALEYSAKGIRVNAIGPAFIDTPLLGALPPGAKEALIGAHPIGRLGRPEEVADLTQYLLSDRASFITGSYHLVDGGYCAQ